MNIREKCKLILGFSPNDEQVTALANIVEWAGEELFSTNFRTLGGYAGTGKSTMVKALSALLRQKQVVLCAPTNKAVKVLKSLGTGNDCCTIYSLLGLKMEQKEDTLVLEKAESDRANKYTFVVIDECGMVNTELLDYIEKAAKKYGIKVLFVGDPGQLNPIGEIRSEVWGRYDIDILRKVERHDNQILNFATEVRQKKLGSLSIISNNDDSGGVWSLSENAFVTKLVEYAEAGAFKEGTKAIAWRNKTVDQMNKLIRTKMHGEASKGIRWVVGDKVVFTAPYDVSEGVNIITDEEVTIENAMWATDPEFGMKTWFLTVRLDDFSSHIIKVVHEDDEFKFKDTMTSLAEAARAKAQESKKPPTSMKKVVRDLKEPTAKELWDAYWDLKANFAQIKYAYAITAHRAQGSTYENVFVDVNDILANSNSKEAKRCLYVAVTRPTTRLFMV